MNATKKAMNSRAWATGVVACAVMGLMVSISSAVPIVGGQVVWMGDMPDGLDLRRDRTESNTDILLFYEATTLLQADLLADWIPPETDPVGPATTEGYITAGTLVKSYLLHFDPVGSPWPYVKASGSVMFNDEEIIGLIFTHAQLNASDAIVGDEDTIYPTGEGRRTEIPGYGGFNDPRPDDMTMDWLNALLQVDFQTGPHVDQVRILTIARTTERVPDGGVTALLLMTTLFGLRYFRRKAC